MTDASPKTTRKTTLVSRPAARRAQPPAAAAATCTLSIDVDAEEAGWTCLGDLSPVTLARQVAAAIPAAVKLPAPETTAVLMLSNDAGVRALNKQWRGLDKPTNVLSFPMPAPPGRRGRGPLELGDIVIAEETLAREAAENGSAVADHFRHLVLHGLLHLLGYDHETDEEAEMMEALETRILATLGVSDPYAGSDPIAQDAPPR